MEEITRHADTGIRMRLHSKLMIGILALECLLMCAVILVVERQMRQSILDEFLLRGLSIARNLAAVNTTFVSTYDYVNIEQNLAKIAAENNLLYAIVRLFDGEVAAYVGPEHHKSLLMDTAVDEQRLNRGETLVRYTTVGQIDGEICDIAVPVLIKEKKWATVRIGFSLDKIRAAVMRTRKLLFILALIALGVGCAASLLLARRITRPIGILVKSVEAMSDGDYEQEIRITTRDEIGYFGNRFSTMQKTLKENITLLTATNRELTDTNHRLQNLFQASQAMNSLQNQEKLHDLILEAAIAATGGFWGSLTLLEQGSRSQIVASAEKGGENSVIADACKLLLEGVDLKRHYFSSADSYTPFQAVTTASQEPYVFLPISTTEIVSHPDLEMVFVPLQQSKHLMGFINLIRRKRNGKVDASETQTLSVLASHATASIENRKLFGQLEDAYLSAIKSLAKTLELKDEYTHGHSERVAMLCVRVGKLMRMDERSLKVLYNAALLHDIGKIGVMESILNKRARLNDVEWQEIKRHPTFGEEILKPISSLREESIIVRHHHEREDGLGYPDGLRGHQLSLSEKIIIMADSFDAMSSRRSYRQPLHAGMIRDELLKNRGSQFNAEVADAFMILFERELMTEMELYGSENIIPIQIAR